MPVTPALLHVEVVPNGDGSTVIACRGELDLSNVAELQRAVGWSMTPQLRSLEIDATALTFIDSTGLRCLVAAATQCRQRDLGFRVLTSAQVARVMELAGLTGLAQGDLGRLSGRTQTGDPAV